MLNIASDYRRVGLVVLGASVFCLMALSCMGPEEYSSGGSGKSDATSDRVGAADSSGYEAYSRLAEPGDLISASLDPPSTSTAAFGYAPPAPTYWHEPERYPSFKTNGVQLVEEEPVSTFSIDVDTASYANVRRFLLDGQLPPPGAVRTEELINAFDYAYPKPERAEEPFRFDLALFGAPWDRDRQLLRIGLQAFEIPKEARPPLNLVFLVDTSGSMDSPDKLPLVQRSLEMLTRELEQDDHVAIVTYADRAEIVLEPTRGSQTNDIIRAIDGFRAGGRTAGGAAIQAAYRLAEEEFDPEAVNRVILATDGDFNVGMTNPKRLEVFIAEKRESGVYLSILGFGRGNLNDLLMQKLAQAGNGNAAYIDSLIEAKRALVEEIGGTLVPIANDVKIQVEFNPAHVAEYRLIGYETRQLERPDFNDDRVDAGEVGSGHSVTAIYEIAAPDSAARLVDDLRYGQDQIVGGRSNAVELAWLRVRYKLPGQSTSRLTETPVLVAIGTRFDEAPSDARFATAVAGFAGLLRRDNRMAELSFEEVHRMARAARGSDLDGRRSEFMRLAETAALLAAVN